MRGFAELTRGGSTCSPNRTARSSRATRVAAHGTPPPGSHRARRPAVCVRPGTLTPLTLHAPDAPEAARPCATPSARTDPCPGRRPYSPRRAAHQRRLSRITRMVTPLRAADVAADTHATRLGVQLARRTVSNRFGFPDVGSSTKCSPRGTDRRSDPSHTPFRLTRPARSANPYPSTSPKPRRPAFDRRCAPNRSAMNSLPVSDTDDHVEVPRTRA